MSFDHKAYLFQYHAFAIELRPILVSALSAGDCGELIQFIESEKKNLRDPYEGEPLTDDWEELVNDRDAHQYGDVAMTKYYNPKQDVGLGATWNELGDELDAHLPSGAKIVLGFTVGPISNPFDPGKMGSYFQSEEMVKENLTAITKSTGNRKFQAKVEPVIQMLKKASSGGRGLYVTF